MDKILFISHRIPYPPNKGDKIRSYHELKFLGQRYIVDVVTFIDDKADYRYIDQLKPLCNSLHVFKIFKILSSITAIISLLTGKSLSEGYYWHPNARRVVRKLANSNNYKFVFCFSSQVAQFVYDLPLRKIMDFCDIDSDKFMQYSLKSRFPKDLLYRIESNRLGSYETQINERFDISLVVTEQEKIIFTRSHPRKNLSVMPNGLDHNYFSPQQVEKEKAIVFTGDMGYYANVDAILWFCNEVFPSVIRIHPDLRLYIVGRNPPSKIINLKHFFPNNITVTGFVEDLRSYISRSRMAVVPLRIARGIQNKVLEAMAMETPVLISEKIYESLTYIDKSEFLVYETAKECIDCIYRSIDNTALLDRMGKRQRTLILKHHNWNYIMENSPLGFVNK